MVETTFPKEEHINQLVIQHQTDLKTYTQETLYGLSRLYLYIQEYTHIHTYTHIYVTIKEKKGQEFEIEQGEVHVKAWQEERKKRNDVIIILKSVFLKIATVKMYVIYVIIFYRTIRQEYLGLWCLAVVLSFNFLFTYLSKSYINKGIIIKCLIRMGFFDHARESWRFQSNRYILYIFKETMLQLYLKKKQLSQINIKFIDKLL